MAKRVHIVGLIALFIAAAAVPVFAQTSGTSTPGTSTEVVGSSTQPSVVPPAASLNCMQSAVNTRDTALLALLDTYNTNVRTALENRKTALVAAWGIANRQQRTLAVRAAWNAFNGAWRRETRNLNLSRRAAWARFESDKLLCQVAGEDVVAERRRAGSL